MIENTLRSYLERELHIQTSDSTLEHKDSASGEKVRESFIVHLNQHLSSGRVGYCAVNYYMQALGYTPPQRNSIIFQDPKSKRADLLEIRKDGSNLHVRVIVADRT